MSEQMTMFGPVEPRTVPTPPDLEPEDGKWYSVWAQLDGDSRFCRVSNGYRGDTVEVEIVNVYDYRERCDDDGLDADGVYNVCASSWLIPRGAFDLKDMAERNHALRAVRSNGAEPDGEWLPDAEAARFAELERIAHVAPDMLATIQMPEFMRGYSWQDKETLINYTPERLAQEKRLALTWYNWSYGRRGDCLVSHYGEDDRSYRSMFPSLREAMEAEDIGRDALPDGEYGDRIWNDDGPEEWGKECKHVRCLIYPRERHFRYVAASLGQALIRHELATAAGLLKHFRFLVNKLDADYVYSSERPEWYTGQTLADLTGYAQLVPESEL